MKRKSGERTTTTTAVENKSISTKSDENNEKSKSKGSKTSVLSVISNKNFHLGFGLCLGLVLILYSRILSYPLIFQDTIDIRKNSDITNPINFGNIFSHNFLGNKISKSPQPYRPLSVLSFAITHKIFGFESFGNHLSNLFLHIVCLFLLVVLVLRIFNLYSTTQSISSTHVLSALLCGILFSVHPLNTETIISVNGRCEILAFLFSLLSLLCYTNVSVSYSNHSDNDEDKKSFEVNALTINIWWLIPSIILGYFAVLAHEQALSVFWICAFYDIFLVCQGKFQALYLWLLKGKTKRELWTLGFGMRMFALGSTFIWLFLNRSFYDEVEIDVLSNPICLSYKTSKLSFYLSQLYCNMVNFKLLFIPSPLSCDWSGLSIILIDSIRDSRNLWTFLNLLFIILGSYLTRLNVVVGFSFSLMIIPFIAISGWWHCNEFVLSEKGMYFSTSGFALLVSSLYWISHRNNSKQSSKTPFQYIVIISLFLCVLFFSSLTYRRIGDWQSERTLYKSSTVSLPMNAKTHYLYSRTLHIKNESEEKEKHLRTAIELQPDYLSAWNDLGLVLSRNDRKDEALDIWMTGLDKSRDSKIKVSGSGRNVLVTNVVGMLEKANRMDEAREILEQEKKSQSE